MLRIILSVIFAKNLFCVIHHNSPKYHISTAWAKRSGANAWASAHALSMVMWYHRNIVNSYHLIKFTHLFKPLLVRVLMVKFPNVSLIFATLSWSLAFHTTSESLIPREFRNGKKCSQNWAEFFQFLCQPVGSCFLKQDSQNTTFPQHERSEAERMRGPQRMR